MLNKHRNVVKIEKGCRTVYILQHLQQILNTIYKLLKNNKLQIVFLLQSFKTLQHLQHSQRLLQCCKCCKN